MKSYCMAKFYTILQNGPFCKHSELQQHPGTCWLGASGSIYSLKELYVLSAFLHYPIWNCSPGLPYMSLS